MIELGKKQELTVAKLVDFGVYLGETENAGEKETVLLPKNYRIWFRKEQRKAIRFLCLFTKIHQIV